MGHKADARCRFFRVLPSGRMCADSSVNIRMTLIFYWFEIPTDRHSCIWCESDEWWRFGFPQEQLILEWVKNVGFCNKMLNLFIFFLSLYYVSCDCIISKHYIKWNDRVLAVSFYIVCVCLCFDFVRTIPYVWFAIWIRQIHYFTINN